MAQRINTFINTNLKLRQLSREAKNLTSLQQQYARIAPHTLVLSSYVVHLTGKTLLIAASNNVVAAKLRQLSPELTQQFQNSGHEVTAIQVKVQVPSSPRTHRSSVPAISAAGQRKLAELAGKLPDSPLKIALHRLLKR